ncbi:MAG: cbb3-type cytochrome oxidase assembly protein CcoS [bacterium]
MNIIYILIPMAMVIVAIIIGVFLWSVRSGQFDDLEGPAWRILHDDDEVSRSDSGSTNSTDNQSKPG